ncbi:MAG: class I SAM-dependent methyltransferase [Bacteroidota bacterium]|nr:class I SAM-dependent methyltransferase [Bacteroidota bacterium]
MSDPQNFFQLNKQYWNAATHIHIASDFYETNQILEGKSSLTEIESTYLPDVSDKSILHLQCHFGLDTISLARKGAQCTGIDFSETAIQKAKELASKINVDIQFIESSVYDVPNLNLPPFDLVFTTYGTIGWLPDLEKWAQVISGSLKPGGQLYFAEFHPFLYLYNFNTQQLEYPYFNTGSPFIEDEGSTYADRNTALDLQSCFWQHSLDEIIGALISNGLEIKTFKEFDFSSYSCFPNMHVIGENRYRFGSDTLRFPHVFLIIAVKK